MSDIKDQSLASQGRLKIEWAEGRNPFGAEKYERFHHGSPMAKKIDYHEDGKNWSKYHPSQKKLLEEDKLE